MTVASARRWVRLFRRAGGVVQTNDGYLWLGIAEMDGFALERLMALVHGQPDRRQSLAAIGAASVHI